MQSRRLWIERQEIAWTIGSLAVNLAKTDPWRLSLWRFAPDVILRRGFAPRRKSCPLQKTRPMIPIVFTQVADPVGFGLVATPIAHPGGNLTGFMAWGAF